MSELLRDAWIQVFGAVAALCLIIMGADRLASRPPMPAPAPPPVVVPSRPVEASSLSAPPPMTNAPKPAASPLPIPPRDSAVDSEPEAAPPAPAAAATAAPPAEAKLKIIRLDGPAKWNRDIFRKKK